MSLIYGTYQLSKLHLMPKSTAVVFIVDDDISVRESLELLVRNQGWEPQLYDSAQAFFLRQSVSVPSCVILDINLPDLNGLEVQREMANLGSSLPVIFVTGYGDIPMTVQAMKAGAAEFLTKPFNEDTMIRAIEMALATSRVTLERDTARGALLERFSTLSKREQEVMTLVVRGLMNKQVGGILDISEITVKAHRGRVMQKMRATTFVDLVNMATALGLATNQRG